MSDHALWRKREAGATLAPAQTLLPLRCPQYTAEPLFCIGHGAKLTPVNCLRCIPCLDVCHNTLHGSRPQTIGHRLQSRRL